jgi:hypothetical protein
MTNELLQECIALLLESIRTRKNAKSTWGDKFDIRKFKELDDTGYMMFYANSFLDIIGIGSSRAVFVLNSRLALKVAIDHKGVAQNKVEVKISDQQGENSIVTKVYDTDPSCMWIVSDLVRPISSEKEFKKLTGVDWKIMTDVVKYCFERGELPRKKSVPRFITEIVNLSLRNELCVADICNIQHWGKTSDGRCVLLDYGYDYEVWSRFYRTKASEDI